jgi:hypothetical protein
MSKEQKQMLLLIILILGIGGGLVYFNLDWFKPRLLGQSVPSSVAARLPMKMGDAQKLFERTGYKKLIEFGSVPVHSMGVGSTNPFASEVSSGTEE